MAKVDAYTRELQAERRARDEFMARDRESPFVSAGVPFHPLRYFPISPRFVVDAVLVRGDRPVEAYLRTNRDGQSVVRYLGDLRFSLRDLPLSLRVFHAGEGVGTSVFVPFRDGTSGRQSYGPGRYLTLELAEDDRYRLDFNRAFNPYCAYTDAYECSFPPAENDLPVPIPAGEMVWDPDRNPRGPSMAVLERTREELRRRAGGRPPRTRPRRTPAGRPR
ncbi:MAG: DUF1684 domain-containing protein [Thermoplasmata archaeon]